MANDRFLNMFLEEARELLQALELGLMDLEARHDDRAHLDRTFRAAHTLKGAAGMVGLGAIAEFTHGVEAILDRIRSGQLGVDPGIISALLAARDHLGAAVEAEAGGQTLAAPPELVARLATIVEGPSPPKEPEPEPEAVVVAPVRETRSFRITLTPRPDLLRKGVNPLGLLDELRELGEATVTLDLDRVPPLDELNPRDCYLSWTIDLTTAAGPEQLDEVFLFLDDRSQVAIEPRTDSPAATSPPPPPPEAREAPTRAAAKSWIRADADQLDLLVGMAGELVVLLDSLQEIRHLKGAGPWVGTIEALERVGGRLRDTTLELRMVPVEELFVRFPRVVRDLAERSGKQIVLVIEGEETRLDRAIIERLFDPMIHLIRNAVDHGLETPDERRAAGKPATGRITIGAAYVGDRVEIRIEEDGRGLDRARIVRKAIAAGLVPPETPPDDPRASTLIFEPGFSTRDQVGELSGRGVGLDVVRDAIHGLRGRVAVRSAPGRGTTFAISLPLTLAMIDGLLVEADGGRYVVPLGQVDECVSVASDDPGWSSGRRALVVRGELVPLVSLRRTFGVADPALDRQELLLTRHADQRIGVAVDRLLGRVQAVIQPLGDGLGHLRHFSGATILGDGSICLIVDLATVVAEARAAAHRARLVPSIHDEIRTGPETARSLP